MGQLFFKKPLQDAIRDGRKRTTIRRWREGKPGVHVGQRVYSPRLGWLTIERVERVQLETLGDSDARADGFDDVAGLREVLMALYPGHRADGKGWYRVAFAVADLHVRGKSIGRRKPGRQPPQAVLNGAPRDRRA
jgi:hypothetical protein